MFKINGVKWQVLMVDPFHPMLMRSDGSFSIGACDNDTTSIYINDTINSRLFKKVLCHEIVHAAMFSYDIDLDREEEEFIADLIASYGEEIINITNSIFSKLRKW